VSTRPPSSDGAPLADVVVPLAKEGIERAGIVVTAVANEALSDELRLPGIVEPNAYRQVSVTPLVAGRVVRVSVQLGDRVRRGQSIAQVYSPELAEARTKYVSAQSMLDAHDRELQRTQKLVEIGAASRQELERIHAEHAAQLAEVQSARSRLELLGASGAASQEGSATIDVPAPIDGIVTERLGNIGVNVDPSTKLFTIVDLSSVWIIANVYERDLHRVRQDARAVIVAKAFPDRSFEGRVGYIDPQLSEDTRTARVRVEVANPRGELRLGMYTDVAIAGGVGGAAIATIPKGALQNVGSRHVVYLPVPNDPTTFTERDVQVGRMVGDRIEVVSGLKPGDSVVSQGSFYLRAEGERLGLRGAATGQVQTARVVVTESGFEPARVSLRAGVPASITLLRTTDKTCATEVVFPLLGIKRALPLNEPITIELTPRQTGEIAFACGMNMLKGTVVVE
jgi:RND family efflux transporter MFP subunit